MKDCNFFAPYIAFFPFCMQQTGALWSINPNYQYKNIWLDRKKNPSMQNMAGDKNCAVNIEAIK